ncbi:hypothetical protein C1X77_26145, partial [Pseudomonas sp. GW531-E2]|uniref:response regulator n=1 Tax=Pseudomonas sp. GW531-E2 TaxID=2070679 RepID=UPI000CB3CBD2
ILDSEKVDLVLSDVKMPNGDGIELLEKIKSKNVRTPAVIFVSGFADIRLEDAYDKGIEAFFTKPFNRKALIEAVNSSIQTSRKWNNRRMVRV